MFSYKPSIIDSADAPIFLPTISDFQCGDDPSPWMCAAGVDQVGGFYCEYISNPGAALNVSINVRDKTGVRVTSDQMILIDSTSADNAGTYSCTVTNVFEGVKHVAVRKFHLFVGGECPKWWSLYLVVVMTSSGFMGEECCGLVLPLCGCMCISAITASDPHETAQQSRLLLVASVDFKLIA